METKMKKVILCVVAMIVALSIGGAVWDWSHEKKREMEFYQKRHANQYKQIEVLSDSIEFLNAKAEFLQITLDYVRTIDSSKVEEAEQILWNIIKEE